LQNSGVDALFLVFMIFIISLFSMVIFLWLAIISLICLLFFCFLWFRFIMFLVLSIHLSSHFLLISSSLSQMNPSIELYPFLFRSGEKFLFLVHFFRVILLYCLWCCFLVPTYLSLPLHLPTSSPHPSGPRCSSYRPLDPLGAARIYTSAQGGMSMFFGERLGVFRSFGYRLFFNTYSRFHLQYLFSLD